MVIGWSSYAVCRCGRAVRQPRFPGLIRTRGAGDGTASFLGDGGSSQKAEINTPEGVRIYNGATYFADSGNNRIRKIDNATLTISTVAGNGMTAYAGDGGKATAASLALPLNMNFDVAGNMYIVDTDNSVVRKVDTNGIISTFAGEDPFDTLNDGGLATMAALGGPQDVFIDQAGDFFLFRAVMAFQGAQEMDSLFNRRDGPFLECSSCS